MYKYSQTGRRPAASASNFELLETVQSRYEDSPRSPASTRSEGRKQHRRSRSADLPNDPLYSDPSSEGDVEQPLVPPPVTRTVSEQRISTSSLLRKYACSKKAKVSFIILVIFFGYFFVTLLLRNNTQMQPELEDATLARKRKFVVISSDDWGAWANSVPHWPSIRTLKEFINEGYEVVHPVWGVASSESSKDLYELGTVVESLNQDVPFRQHVVITPFFIVGGPDYEAMRETGCPESPTCEYRELLWNSSSGLLGREPYNRGDLRPFYTTLFQRGVWHPEYHGRAHMGAHRWAKLLPEDKLAQRCFHASMTCAEEYGGLRSEYTDFAEEEDMYRWAQDGVNAFHDFWGYRPLVGNCPHNVSNEHQGRLFKRLGFVGSETYVPDVAEVDDFSYLDRFRFDPFWPMWVYKEKMQQLSMTLRKEKYVSLMWHAQNIVSATYSNVFHKYLIQVFVQSIRYIRSRHPEVVFVTSSELHQIRLRGWSREVWSDHFRYRNYKEQSVKVKIENLIDLYKFGHDWSGKTLVIQNLEKNHFRECKVGDSVWLSPGQEYIVRIKQRGVLVIDEFNGPVFPKPVLKDENEE